MSSMGQLVDLIGMAAAVLAALLLVAFTIGRFFRDKRVRKRLMIGAIGVYGLALVVYFGFISFILSGNLN